MNWYRNALRDAERQKWESLRLRPTPRVVYRIPEDAVCYSCIQELGSSVCRNVCTYWRTLQDLKAQGKLEVVG